MSAHKQNPADLLREYSVAELERIAEQYHEKHKDGFAIPVDIELIIESTPGIDLDVYPRLMANHGVMGMAGINKDGTFSIFIDDVLADNDAQQRKARMTLAEEFAHLLIHGDAIRKVNTPQDFALIHNHPKWPLYDRNAKRLAAALLMPARTLIEDGSQWYSLVLSKLPDNSRFNNPHAVQKMIIGKLADKYDVSISSMRYRLGEWPVRLLNKIEKAMCDRLTFLS